MLALLLACHAEGRGSNRYMTKYFCAPILWGTLPHGLALSFTMPVIKRSNVNTNHRGGKKGGIVVKILAALSVRQNTDIGVMHGRKG